MAPVERTEYVKLRVTPEEKARFERLAAREGLTVSDLIRRRVFSHVEERPAEPMTFGGVGWPE